MKKTYILPWTKLITLDAREAQMQTTSQQKDEQWIGFGGETDEIQETRGSSSNIWDNWDN